MLESRRAFDRYLGKPGPENENVFAGEPVRDCFDSSPSNHRLLVDSHCPMHFQFRVLVYFHPL